VPIILAVNNDLHINSTIALCPEVFNRDDGGLYYPSPTQKWIWNSWLDFWGRVRKLKKKLRAPVYSVLNGDLVDVNSHSHYQIISLNEFDVIDNAIRAIKPALDVSDYTFVVRGTEAHVGGSSWFEEQIAKEIGAERDAKCNTHSWYWLEMELEKVGFGFAHQPCTNSFRRWTQGAAANRQAATLVYNYFGEDWYPEVCCFGHFHHDEDSFDNHPIRAIYLPPWAAHSSYDKRTRAWEIPKIGGNIFVIEDGKYDLEKVRYRPKRRSPWRPKKQLSKVKDSIRRIGIVI